MKCPKCQSDSMGFVKENNYEGGYLMTGYFKCPVCSLQIQDQKPIPLKGKKENVK